MSRAAPGGHCMNRPVTGYRVSWIRWRMSIHGTTLSTRPRRATDQLSVPVKGGNSKQSIKDVEIDYTQKWMNRHWRAIQSAYGKAPFYEYYSQEIKAIIYKQHRFLFDLNLELLTLCLKFLQIDANFELTLSYLHSPKSNLDDFRSLIHPKKDYFPTYNYNPVPYFQLFGKTLYHSFNRTHLFDYKH